MVTALVLTLCLSCAMTHVQDPASNGMSRVHFSIDQAGDLSQEQLTRAIDQVRQIWRSAGIAVSAGRYGEPAPPDATRISLRMVYVKHSVDHTVVLAWTTMAPDRRLAPALFVSVPGLTELLSTADVKGRPFNQRPRELRDRLLGQAIGRVTAHELGHFLLQRAGHADQGLLRPRYSTADLIEPWLHPFEVAVADRQIVRREVANLARLQAGMRGER